MTPDRNWYPQRKTADAPIALLKTFMYHLGFPVSRATIERDVAAHAEFPTLSMEAIQEILKKWGLIPVAYPVEWEQLTEIPSPSIAFIHEIEKNVKVGAFVMFNKLDGEIVEYVHPRKGWAYEHRETFESKWEKVLLSIAGASGDGERDFEEQEIKYDENKYANPDLNIVTVFEGFLSDEECQHIVQLSNDKFNRSEVDGQDIVSGRSSYSSYLTQLDDPVLNAVRKKCSELIELPESHFEPFQCVSYKVGQEY